MYVSHLTTQQKLLEWIYIAEIYSFSFMLLKVKFDKKIPLAFATHSSYSLFFLQPRHPLMQRALVSSVLGLRFPRLCFSPSFFHGIDPTCCTGLINFALHPT